MGNLEGTEKYEIKSTHAHKPAHTPPSWQLAPGVEEAVLWGGNTGRGRQGSAHGPFLDQGRDRNPPGLTFLLRFVVAPVGGASPSGSRAPQRHGLGLVHTSPRRCGRLETLALRQVHPLPHALQQGHLCPSSGDDIRTQNVPHHKPWTGATRAELHKACYPGRRLSPPAGALALGPVGSVCRAAAALSLELPLEVWRRHLARAVWPAAPLRASLSLPGRCRAHSTVHTLTAGHE